MNDVLCFGDSNTYGTVPMRDPSHDERFPFEERWTGVLARILGDDCRVVEEGLPGRTTVHDDAIEGASRNGATYLVPCLGSHRPIGTLVLALGTNDLKTRFSLTPEDVARGVGTLLDLVQASRSGPGGGVPNILLVAPAPVREIGFLGEIFVGGAAKSQHLAGKYAQVAQRYGASFLDAATVVQVSDVDGVHLAVDQHRRLGEAVAMRVREMGRPGKG